MNNFTKAIKLSFIMVILCGFIYPLAMTGISQLIFPKQANGSIIEKDGKTVGSELLGQNFSDARYLHGRVSAYNYNTYTEDDMKPDVNGKASYAGVGSGSSNIAPSNPILVDRVQKDIDKFLKDNPELKREDITTDLLTSSASGLDPHISPRAAKIQIPSISKATGIPENELQIIVDKYTEGKTFNVFGEPRVNILKVNLEIAGKIR